MPHTQHQVVGTLLRDAEVRRCLGGAYVVCIELRQPREDAPVVAMRQYGFGATADLAAHAAAHHLRRGTPVRVWCNGIGTGHTSDAEAAIALRGVDLITPLTPVQTTAPDADRVPV